MDDNTMQILKNEITAFYDGAIKRDCNYAHATLPKLSPEVVAELEKEFPALTFTPGYFPGVGSHIDVHYYPQSQ